jgi:hypothetical protein
MMILPRIDVEKMLGICEMHVHSAPSIFERPFDDIELAKQMREIGYRAVLIKCHHTVTAARAQLVRKMVPGIDIYGGVVLNYPVGGLNPLAVEAAIG